MTKKQADFEQKIQSIETENQELRQRLEEADEALNAIKAGQVDALVVYGAEGEQVFTLEGADTTYRLMIENIHEGAANTAPDGTILYCNRRLAEMLALPLETVFGSSFYRYLKPAEQNAFTALIKEGMETFSRAEFRLICNQPGGLPVLITASATRINQMQGICLVITDLTQQKEAAARESELHLRLSQQREEERVRIARNLHDGPLQDVIALSFTLQDLALSDPEMNADLLAIRATVLKLTADLRGVCNELRPPNSIRFGLASAIRYQMEEIQSKNPDLAVQLDLWEDDQLIPEAVRMALFRIFQESINNILRHACATAIEIRLLLDQNSVQMEVQDNGKGFQVPGDWTELSKQGHLGLVGMRERAEAIGGQFAVVSGDSNGTIIRIGVPNQ